MHTCHHINDCLGSASFSETVACLASRVRESIRAMVAHQRERLRLFDELSRMDDHDLADIGMQRSDIDLVLAGRDVPGAKRRTGDRQRRR